MFSNHPAAFSPEHLFRVADLGCSFGPNALFVIWRIIGKIEELCKENGYGLGPELEVFLNDLPENDFNNVFMMLPEFYQKLNNNHENTNNMDVISQRPKTFIYGLPGSFYGRLVPRNSLNFVHSSYGLQWRSQVPQGLENNRENIHHAMASPPDVFAAYYSQFKRDFTTFLESRAVEMVVGARMVLTFVSRSVEDRSTKDEQQHLKLLSDTLIDMVQEGLVKEADLHSFNFPIYTPSKQEVETLVRENGSFNLDRLEGFFLPWDSSHVKHDNDYEAGVDKFERGRLASIRVRAYSEPILVSHFGKSIMDDLFARYAKKMAEHLSKLKEEPSLFNIVISLSKK
ncbi:S-adenosyl-L-methionine-dependent methyltransferases superfamily protein [Striga hermonthica]|uniref:S-adenosyl-L-methionine-dependent methyltransferases superfamily protein n=1 Tax=Striga hermonthica TaxID=68872 RepID=A0A9N7N3D2_STRHE|nr:S-adenosyl-L-methionine-dependent methyltransferases superfamily protein [Striga hermonthica]